MTHWIDVRSDTVTTPTPAMRTAMAEAEVGDDVYQDDPTVNRLEELAAEMTGKEAALFVPSGTMGNQLAVMTHTTPGDEMIVGARCHIVDHEVGASPRLCGVGYAIVDHPDNIIRPEDVRRLVRPDDIHCPTTTLLCLENALADGNVVPLDVMQATYRQAKACGLAVHLDGARLFNAALALGVGARDITALADSVMVCLSKGLCAPVGSMLCGSAAFVASARKYRKMLGGGMRQVGILAAAGILALTEMTKRLADDHANAAMLADRLAAIPGVTVARERVEINMVFWRPEAEKFSPELFAEFMRGRGIRTSGPHNGEYRFLTNKDVSAADAARVADAVREYMASL
ncbi:MAG: low-specificity L-threonine aldolase [Planctomycetaceae bacterium]|nr:low-specificity L-threonine aldolase [Planctomycetaceae bacterium]